MRLGYFKRIVNNVNSGVGSIGILCIYQSKRHAYDTPGINLD